MSASADAALAALIALLDPAAFPHEDYLAALDRTGGDVERAAESLLLGEGSNLKPERGKRGLENWLRPPKRAKSEVRTELAKNEPKTPGSAGPGSTSQTPSPPRLDRAASASQWATLLKAPAGAEKTPAPRGTIHLTPATLAGTDLPLALLPSPLDARTAAALYHELLAESPSWPRNRWFLAGREVESNHQATSYAQPGGGFGAGVGVPYFYASKKYDAKPYTPILTRAAELVEEAVNTYLEGIARYPWEYRGRWRANMCAANRYDGAQSTRPIVQGSKDMIDRRVGFHADQMTYLGPYPTIASLSLGTPRAFRLRATEATDPAYAGPPARTYEVTLGHNSLCLMTPGCQERYKHTVPPQRALDTFRPGWDEDGNAVPPGEGKAYTTRINITFRFYRDDFHPSPGTGPYGPRSGTPICKCGIPTLLRADQKAKARSRMGGGAYRGRAMWNGRAVREDDMAFFWQCQSPGTTGQLKGCGFFKILDMRGEGRGPCIGSEDEDDEDAERQPDAEEKQEELGTGGASGKPDDARTDGILDARKPSEEIDESVAGETG